MYQSPMRSQFSFFMAVFLCMSFESCSLAICHYVFPGEFFITFFVAAIILSVVVIEFNYVTNVNFFIFCYEAATGVVKVLGSYQFYFRVEAFFIIRHEDFL